MKRRGMASPDMGDMLAMTFSVKVAARKPIDLIQRFYEPDCSGLGWMR